MKKRAIALLSALWLATTQTALALPELSLGASGDEVVITADFGTELAGREATLEVCLPGQTGTEVTDAGERFGYVGQKRLDENGAFSVSLIPGKVSGIYTARLQVLNIFEPITAQLRYASREDTEALVKRLNGLDPAAEESKKTVEELFKTAAAGRLSGAEILGLTGTEEYELMSKMTGSFKSAVYASFLGGAADASDRSEVQQLFRRSVCIEGLLLCSKKEAAVFLEKKSDALGIAGSVCYKSIFADELRGSKAVRDVTAERLISRKWTQADKGSFEEIFAEQCFWGAIDEILTSGGVEPVVLAAGEWLESKGLELDTYLALGQRSSVNAVVKDDYASMSEFANAFNAACARQREAEKNVGGGKKSGGLGGSGSTKMLAEGGQLLPKPVGELTEAYNDIGGVPWAREGITALTEKGFIKGRVPGRFYPDESMKREEFVKLLVMAFALPEEEAEVSFEDVPEEAWFYSYVTSAAKSGLVMGRDGLFGAGEPITRQDAAALLYRAAQKSGKTFSENGAPAFADTSRIAAYAREAVAALGGSGIISGISDTEFAPERKVTRAEAAKLIYLLISTEGSGEQ